MRSCNQTVEGHPLHAYWSLPRFSTMQLSSLHFWELLSRSISDSRQKNLLDKLGHPTLTFSPRFNGGKIEIAGSRTSSAPLRMTFLKALPRSGAFLSANIARGRAPARIEDE